MIYIIKLDNIFFGVNHSYVAYKNELFSVNSDSISSAIQQYYEAGTTNNRHSDGKRFISGNKLVHVIFDRNKSLTESKTVVEGTVVLAFESIGDLQDSHPEYLL
jgi:hypothetical protein